jgi:hypothetical protein
MTGMAASVVSVENCAMTDICGMDANALCAAMTEITSLVDANAKTAARPVTALITGMDAPVGSVAEDGVTVGSDANAPTAG